MGVQLPVGPPSYLGSQPCVKGKLAALGRGKSSWFPQAAEPKQMVHPVSQNKHGVAVTVETVVVCDCSLVGEFCEIDAADCAN